MFVNGELFVALSGSAVVVPVELGDCVFSGTNMVEVVLWSLALLLELELASCV